MSQDAPTIELFGAPTGNCVRVAIALEEAGVPYRATPVDLRKGEHLAPDYLDRNPFGKVPTLIDHAQAKPFRLSQSNAILFHIDGLRPGSLLPEEPRARATAIERFFYFITDVIAPNHAAFQLRLDDERAARDRLNLRSHEALKAAERFVKGACFMGGDQFGLADIAAFTFARTSGVDFYEADCPALARWYGSVSQRPAVQRGLRVFADW